MAVGLEFPHNSAASASHFVHQRIRGSRLVTLDATGHCPQLSAPDATTREILAFLGDTE